MRKDPRLGLVLTATIALVWGLMVGAPGPATAATLTPPDMKIQVPTNLISIGLDPTSGHPMLRFTHITWDAGTGPFEIDPTYNSATGTATFIQSLYNSPSPGVWSLDHTVPVAATGVFSASGDYQFPLTRFTLNSINADGSIGAAVATSPKTDYCITANTRVGTVPNTPSNTFIPQSNCTDPTKPLGWSVGWGDQYDQTDPGQPIDLSGITNGTYILRAVADPLHVLTESDATNNVTDTVLAINGTSVSVVSQSNPKVVPPSVSVTSPLPGASVSGTVTVSANAAATSPATVSTVQFLLDGQPLGAPVTASPYTYSWTVGNTPPGTHYLSARATDTAGNTNTAAVVPVSVPSSSTGLAVDQSIQARGSGPVTTAAFSTATSGETLIAEVSSDGASTGGQTATVSGAGLAWSLVRRSNSVHGDAEIWSAIATTALTGVTVTSTPGQSGYSQQLTVQSFMNSGGIGASGSAAVASGPPSVSFASKSAGSLTYAVGQDWDSATARTLASGQQMVAQWLNTTTGDTFWLQTTTALTTAAGQTVTLSDTAPTADEWNMAGVEIIPGASSPPPPDMTPPTVQITNPTAGQTVSGTITVAANATDNVAVSSVQFLLDSQPLGSPVTASPYVTSWNTTTAINGAHTLSAKATDPSGNIGTAPAITVTVQNPAPPMICFVLQANVNARGTGTVQTPGFSTVVAGEVLLAFVSMDGPSGAGNQSATVSGAGLTWKLVGRANSQSGDAEIWSATASTVLNKVTVKSAPTKTGYAQDLTVVAYEGAAGTGAVSTGSAASRAPGLTVTTTSATSLVFAVGHDWDNATARTLPTGFAMLDQWVDPTHGDTSWSEYTNQSTGAAGTQVKIGATAPTTDQWNMTAVELRNSGS
ncbi:Ig-like domain-containing protein [Arthrobacter sp. MI7-26]|uniref:Ig-like domain-containing protein n=1 Tax=Arthrobacter sp. MI7-26 TaxID=2993653 RepID=UPI002248D94F|nr:Ig-like domain-containing protein [Arthrobacter sp. MI7-26]MCX2747028.1 Ig-like domain-containing protein [Arthrobacter sp. MI7-26]